MVNNQFHLLKSRLPEIMPTLPFHFLRAGSYVKSKTEGGRKQ
jgi:hypothetical protein